jgi:hypothetical protein
MKAKWPHVFILSVGRSGSKAFAKACSHITNYTSGHETNSSKTGKTRLEYPIYHIESDAKISWMLGSLEERFGDAPLYVHLIRDKDAVVKSWDKRWNYSFSGIRHFSEGVLSNVSELLSDADKRVIGEQHYDVVNANISLFLRDKSNVMSICLEEIDEKFPRFWKAIGAEGNLPAALEEFKQKHNTNASNEVVEKREREFRFQIQRKVLQNKISTVSWGIERSVLLGKLLILRIQVFLS